MAGIATGLSLIVFGITVWCHLRISRQQVRLTEFSEATLQSKQKVQGLEQQVKQLKQQLIELQSGSLGMGHTLKSLVGQLADTEQRQAALEAAEPAELPNEGGGSTSMAAECSFEWAGMVVEVEHELSAEGEAARQCGRQGTSLRSEELGRAKQGCSAL